MQAVSEANKDLRNDVDVIIEVEKGVAKANGRFGIGTLTKVLENFIN